MIRQDRPLKTFKKTLEGTFGGRPVTREEVSRIRETVEMFGNLSRTELTHTICEHLDWRTASGTNKWDACLKMLKDFEKKGLIRLPVKQTRPKPIAPRQITHSRRTAPGPVIDARLKDVPPVVLDRAESRARTGLWNEYVDRYHYLGYRRPFGYRIRYFIRSGDLLLGCMLFSGSARAISPRDRWIGWGPEQRRKNQHLVVNNTRFLIFPWVNIRFLASHALGLAARRIPGDWRQKWGFSPVLLETFVDPQRYTGTAYKAANWQELGLTSGQGLVRQGKSYTTHPRKIFVLPLARDASRRLCN